MANPIFEQFNSIGSNQNNDTVSQFMNDFKRLQQTIANPQKEVENLLRTGRMTQQQFNQLSVIANQLMPKIN